MYDNKRFALEGTNRWHFLPPKQINGMEMAEARHETAAVTLLTKCKEIDLVVLRESMVIEHHEPLVSKYAKSVHAIMQCSPTHRYCC